MSFLPPSNALSNPAAGALARFAGVSSAAPPNSGERGGVVATSGPCAGALGSIAVQGFDPAGFSQPVAIPAAEPAPTENFQRSVSAEQLRAVLMRRFDEKPSCEAASAALSEVFGGKFRLAFLSVLLSKLYGPTLVPLPVGSRLRATRVAMALQHRADTPGGLRSRLRLSGDRQVVRALEILRRRELVEVRTGLHGGPLFVYTGLPGLPDIPEMPRNAFAAGAVRDAIQAWRRSHGGEVPTNNDIALELARLGSLHVSQNGIGYGIASEYVCTRNLESESMHDTTSPIYGAEVQKLIAQYVRDHQSSGDRLPGVKGLDVVAYLQCMNCPGVKKAWKTLAKLVADGVLSKTHTRYTTAGLCSLPGLGPITGARLDRVAAQLSHGDGQWNSGVAASAKLRKSRVRSHFVASGYHQHKKPGLAADKEVLTPLLSGELEPDRPASEFKARLRKFIQGQPPNRVLTNAAARRAVSSPRSLFRELKQLCEEGLLMAVGRSYVIVGTAATNEAATHGLRIRPAQLPSERSCITALVRRLERMSLEERQGREVDILLSKIREYAVNIRRSEPACTTVTHVVQRLAVLGLRMEDSPFVTSGTATLTYGISLNEREESSPPAAAPARSQDTRSLQDAADLEAMVDASGEADADDMDDMDDMDGAEARADLDEATTGGGRVPGAGRARQVDRDTVLAFIARLGTLGSDRIRAAGRDGPGDFGRAGPRFSTVPENVRHLYGYAEIAHDRRATLQAGRRDDIDHALGEFHLRIEPNTASDRANSWIISLLQHAFEDYGNSHLAEADAIRRQLSDRGMTQDGEGMTTTSPEARLALHLVNRHPRTVAPLRVHTFVDAAGYLLTSATAVEDEAGRPLKDVLVKDCAGHFDAVVRA